MSSTPVKMTRPSLEKSYAWCQQLARSHYENFPVASLLLPKRLRRPVSVIYAFARTADDFADEGKLKQSDRLQKLAEFSEALRQIRDVHYQGTDPIFIALADVISQYRLSVGLFEDLLRAFKQDVVKARYQDFDEVMDYCRYSANPVGRLLLQLTVAPSEQQYQQSDAICSALQLINFYQDIAQDYHEQNRIYIPQNELALAGLEESDLIQENSSQLAPVLRHLYQRAAVLMKRGYPLGNTLSGRMGWEVRAMTLGGLTTLYLLSSQSDDELLARPRLHKGHLFHIITSAACPGSYARQCRKLLERIRTLNAK
jgi:hydroxysqualene synthase